MTTDKEQQIWFDSFWNKLEVKFKAESERIKDKIPYIAENGRYKDMAEDNIGWWTNGFWPGMLWLMYAYTGEENYRLYAKQIEDKIAVTFTTFEAADHDQGFRWQLSAVADYRLTKDEVSLKRGMHGATILGGRFNPVVEYLRAHDHKERKTWFIVDCMMNLPLLYWASEVSGDQRFAAIAKRHADTSLQYILREDGSCNHVVITDETTGECVDTPGGQGYEKGSSWSRGQAWAIYGFCLSYRYTGDKRYLDGAKRTANYFITQITRTNYIPKLDFRAPDSLDLWDTSAAAITACGLLDISAYCGAEESENYTYHAIQILKALEKECDWDLEKDGILQRSSVMYSKEHHVSLIYGDFYLMEALLKLKNGQNGFHIW